VVGSGSFYLPSAFAAGGFALSIISLTLLGALTTYTNNLAIALKNLHFPRKPSSYFDVARKGLGRLFGVLEYVSIIIVSVGTMR
jgi:amino acid permease